MVSPFSPYFQSLPSSSYCILPTSFYCSYLISSYSNLASLHYAFHTLLSSMVFHILPSLTSNFLSSFFQKHLTNILSHRTHSGVCHSDLAIMTNTWKMMPYPTPEGQVGGHEGVGKIVKMGPGAEASSGVLKVGDRVGIKWMAGICGACEACRAGADANCFNGVSSI